MIKVVVSDLYGVHLYRNEETMRSDFAQVSGLAPDAVASAIKAAGREDLKLGRIEPQEYVAGLNARLGTSLSVAEVQEIWNRTLHADQQMVGLLHRLQDQGTQVVLLSNLNAFDWADAAKLGLARFDAVLSYQARLKKPDPEIFRLVLQKTGLPPGCHFYLDDQRKNVKVAWELGMHETQFREYDALVQSLNEHGVTIA